MYNITLNEIINLRGAFRDCIDMPSRFNRSSWIGICPEIIQALLESDKVNTGHLVYLDDAGLCIRRHGYFYPHFFYVGKGQFLCPYWTRS